MLRVVLPGRVVGGPPGATLSSLSLPHSESLGSVHQCRQGLQSPGPVLSLFSAGPRWQLLALGLPSASLWDLCLPGISCLASAGGASLWGPNLPPAPSSSPEAAALPGWAQKAPYRHMTGKGCPHPPPRGCSPVSGHVSLGLSSGLLVSLWGPDCCKAHKWGLVR